MLKINSLHLSCKKSPRSSFMRGGAVLSLITLLGCTPFVALAQQDAGQQQEIRVVVNGQRVHFSEVGAQQVNGRVLVPVRGVLEQIGAEVKWNDAEQEVTAKNDTTSIRLHIGDRRARVNGADVVLDVPAQTFHDHTMVPLRFLGEALGAKVRWSDSERTVFIMTGDHANTGDAHPEHSDRKHLDGDAPNR